MIEIVLALVVTFAGIGVLAPLVGRLPWVAVACLAVPIGGAVHMMLAVLLLAVTGSVDPVLVLAGDMVAGLVGFGVAAARGRFGVDLARAAALAGWVVAAVAWLVWSVHLARLTPDSLRYLLGAADIQLPEAATHIHPTDLMKRQFGLQSLHALSAFTPRGYVAWVAPLFGIATTGFFSWLLWTRLGGPARRRALIIGAAVVFALSSNRFLYNFFYINGHMQTAAFMLVAIAGAWLAARDDQPAWAFPAGVALGATLLMRPEAPLVAALVLVPVAASRAGWAVRWLMTVPSMVALALWYGLVLWSHAPGARATLTDPVTGNMAVVIVAITGVLVAGTGVLPGVVRFVGRAAVPIVAAVLLLHAAFNPVKLFEAVGATAANLIGYGLWMIAWPMALLLLLIALFVHRVPDSRFWTTPIMGFAFLFFLLPYIRESPWRVGTGDSGNRILLHMFIVVLAFVILALAGEGEDQVESADERSGQPG